MNFFQNVVHAPCNGLVPEPQHQITLPFDERVARGVARWRILAAVLGAVEFDDEHRLDAGEIRDERADRVLTTKAKPAELFEAQPRP